MLVPNAYLPVIGGVELIVHNLSKQLLKRGHNINIVTQRRSHSGPRELIDGVIVDRIPFRSIPYAVCRIWRLLKKNRVEIVHIQNVSFSALSVLLVSYICKFKLIVTLQGSFSVSSRLFPAAAERRIWLFRRILKKADYVTACSRNLLIEAQKRVPEVEGKSGVINNGIDMEEFNQREKHVHSRPYIFSLANFYHHKGLDILIMAFKSVTEKYKNIDLIITGDGIMKEDYRRLAGLLGLKDKVIFWGSADRRAVVRLFNGCEFFVLPSRCEPFGIVNLEAMAAGKAIVAADSGGVPEIVKGGVNGILVRPGNDRALAKGMIRLLEDTELSDRLGENGRKMVDRYRWEKITDAYLDVYNKVLNE